MSFQTFTLPILSPTPLGEDCTNSCVGFICPSGLNPDNIKHNPEKYNLAWT